MLDAFFSCRDMGAMVPGEDIQDKEHCGVDRLLNAKLSQEALALCFALLMLRSTWLAEPAGDWHPVASRPE